MPRKSTPSTPIAWAERQRHEGRELQELTVAFISHSLGARQRMKNTFIGSSQKAVPVFSPISEQKIGYGPYFSAFSLNWYSSLDESIVELFSILIRDYTLFSVDSRIECRSRSS